MPPHTRTPALVHLTTDGASSPLGPSAPSLSRASGACHQTPHVMLPTHPNRAAGLPPPRPPQVLPLRLAANRSARCRRNRPLTHPQGPWSTPDSRATPSGTLPPSSHTMGHTTGARSRCDGPTPQTATTRRVSHALGFASTCPHRCTRSRLHPHPRHTHHRAPPRSRLILSSTLRLQAPPPPLTHGRPRQARTARRATKNKTDLVPITGTPSSFGPPHNTPAIPAPIIPTGSPVLTVNACWAIPILMGLKTWEIRSQNALKRGTIYIAISGLSEIWGEVTLTDSHKPSASEWNHSSLKHRIAHRSDPSSPHPPFATQPWAWHFTCARLYESPVPASRPKGPVVWTTFTPVVSDSGPAMDEATPHA